VGVTVDIRGMDVVGEGDDALVDVPVRRSVVTPRVDVTIAISCELNT
jgi:hypothetical protein